MMAKKPKAAGERRGPYDYWRFDGSMERLGWNGLDWQIWLHGMAGLALRTRNPEAKAFFSMWFSEIDD